MPTLDHCINAVYEPGNIGASSGQVPVQPSVPSFFPGYAAGVAAGIGAANGVGATAAPTAGAASGTGAASGVGVAVVSYATLDGTASNVTLSNGNLTATHDNTTSNSGARSTTLKNSGKYYFEVTITDIDGANDAVGLLTAAGTFTNLVSNGSNCFAVYRSGNIWANGAFSTKTLGTMGDGQVVQIAVDLDADLAWARRETTDWNGQSGDNPATAVGGISISSFSGTTMGPAVGFGGTGTQAGDNMTCNFGATAFVHSVPSGFTSGWPV